MPVHKSAEERKAAMRKAVTGNLPEWAWLMVYFLGAMVTAALGLYAGITALITAFESPQVTAFTCHSPLDAS